MGDEFDKVWDNLPAGFEVCENTHGGDKNKDDGCDDGSVGDNSNNEADINNTKFVFRQVFVFISCYVFFVLSYFIFHLLVARD